MPTVFHRSSVLRGLEDSAKDRAELAQMRRKIEATDLLVGRWIVPAIVIEWHCLAPTHIVYIVSIYIYILNYTNI